ncbi:MAG: PQQ-like beta-propeller repeat protein [Planctomycetes bacterium]|nr:PQQ-like beta-propeller repeat protein [Planctomycetota bacterium]
MRFLAATMATAFLFSAAARADWPNFRGPRHDGISAEKGLKTTWPEPPKMRWEAKVGDSFSGMSIVGDRLYTCGTADKKQQVLCLDANTGKPIWNFPLEDGYFEPQGGNGARATPTIADGKLYLLGALGRLVCLDAKDGKVIWEKKFEGKPQWGFSASVLIEGDLAITSGGGKQGALIAYDKNDGKEIWKYGTDKAGYSTPYPFTIGSKRYLVGFTGTKVSIVHAESGVVAWDTAWKTDWDVNAASPIFDAGKLFISSGYDTGSAVFSLAADGDKLSGKNLWGEVKKVLLSKFQSAVLHEGNLYCSDQRKLACVDFLTGEEKWKEPRMENATIVLVENDLFIQCEDGRFVIAPATPTGYKPTATFKALEGKCWTVPTLDNGRLYTRSLDTIRCFEMR